MTRRRLRALIEGGLNQAHEAVVRSFLPEGARITFEDPTPPLPEPEPDPNFLFGGFELPRWRLPEAISSPRFAPSSPAQAKARKEQAAKAAKATFERYGEITERRDVFFERAVNKVYEVKGMEPVYTMPLSVLDSPAPLAHKE